MKYIQNLILALSLIFWSHCMGQGDILFTNIQSEEILNFEEQIGYFFGIKDPQPVIDEYMLAIKALEMNANYSDKIKIRVMKPGLEKAYMLISQKTGFKFDTKKAAELEAALILAQAKRARFHYISNIMVAIYQEVFGTNSDEVKKAAMIRTFLYQYKTEALSSTGVLSNTDKQVMLAMARASEEILNNFLNSRKNQ